MAVVKAFKGFRYHLTSREEKLELKDVVVPPYDVISPLELEILKSKSQYNFSNIILANPRDDYREARERLALWREKEILRPDAKPCLYFYKQVFSLGSTFSRTGIFARIGLEDYSSKIILPHEQTFSHHKDDRYKLMEATGGNMEPVFLGYNSERFSGDEFEKIILSRKPEGHYTDDAGTEHFLWAIDDVLVHEEVEKVLRMQKFYILDGHHRYETALKYFKDHQNSDTKLSHRYLLANICSFKQPGMVILPTHRLLRGLKSDSLNRCLKNLENDFIYREVENVSDLEKDLSRNVSALPAFGLKRSDSIKYIFMQMKEDAFERYGKPLDLDVLHEKIIPMLEFSKGKPDIDYVKNISEWEAKLLSKEYELGFLIRPTKAEEVMKVATEGKKMPHKSTFFYPKIPSGLVINLFDS
jgi:uncharacterized protein (DUF1015 family)